MIKSHGSTHYLHMKVSMSSKLSYCTFYKPKTPRFKIFSALNDRAKATALPILHTPWPKATVASSGMAPDAQTLAVFSPKVYVSLPLKPLSPATCSAKAFILQTSPPNRQTTAVHTRPVISACCCSAKLSSGNRCWSSRMQTATRVNWPRSKAASRHGARARRARWGGKMPNV